MKHFVYYLVWGLVVLMVWGNENSVATPPPPLPQPCEIDLRVEGTLSIGHTFTVTVELKDAPSPIDGQIFVYASEGLEIIGDDTLINMSITADAIQSYEISVKIVSGKKHTIRASFLEIGTEGKRFGVAQKEKYIDLSQATPQVLDTVGRDFFRTDSINVIDGIPTKGLNNIKQQTVLVMKQT